MDNQDIGHSGHTRRAMSENLKKSMNMNHCEPKAGRHCNPTISQKYGTKWFYMTPTAWFSYTYSNVPSLMEKPVNVSYGETILPMLPITSLLALSITEFSSESR